MPNYVPQDTGTAGNVTGLMASQREDGIWEKQKQRPLVKYNLIGFFTPGLFWTITC